MNVAPVFEYQCFHCQGPMTVQFTQSIVSYSKKKGRTEIKNQCVPICCAVCSGRIARKVNNTRILRHVNAI